MSTNQLFSQAKKKPLCGLIKEWYPNSELVLDRLPEEASEELIRRADEILALVDKIY